MSIAFAYIFSAAPRAARLARANSPTDPAPLAASRDARDRGFILLMFVAVFTMLLSCAPYSNASTDPTAPAPSSSAVAIAASATSTIRTDNDTLALTNLQATFQAVADRVAPSVVAISAALDPIDSDDALRAADLTGEKLDGLLEHVTRTVGTGFIIASDGYIVTNEHVVGESKQIWVTTDDRRVFPAIIVGSDPRADVAVLKIPAHDLVAAKFAGRLPNRGEWSITLGNPYGLASVGEMAMSVGVISATDRSLPKLATRENRLYTNLLQTTAQINPGNSGGPLFNIDGDVIGINTAVVMPQKQTNGIGFAMPITPAMIAKFEQLKSGEPIAYGFIGVTVTTPTPRQRHDYLASMNAQPALASGAIVDSVELGSPADIAGLKIGDLVLAIDDHLVRDGDSFVRAVGDARPDRATDVLVLRAGSQKPSTLKVTPRPRELPGVAVTKATRRFRWNGLLLGPAEHGVAVLEIAPSSPFAAEKLCAGAVISEVDGTRVNDLLELQQVVNDSSASEQVKLTLAAPAATEKQHIATIGE